MTPDTLFRLMADIKCGKYQCLTNCCDQLGEIHRLMRTIDATDIPTLSKLLCGCEVTTQPPKDQNCLRDLASWLGENGTLLNGLQFVLLSFGGTSIPGLDQFVTALSIGLEAIEDVYRAKPDETTIADKLDEICKVINLIDQFKRWAVSNLPDSLSLLRDAANAVPVGKVITLGCCPAYEPPALGGGTGTGGGSPPPMLPSEGTPTSIPTSTPVAEPPPEYTGTGQYGSKRRVE